MPSFDEEKKNITFHISELQIAEPNDDEVLQIQNAFSTSVIEEAKNLGVKKVIKRDEQGEEVPNL